MTRTDQPMDDSTLFSVDFLMNLRNNMYCWALIYYSTRQKKIQTKYTFTLRCVSSPSSQSSFIVLRVWMQYASNSINNLQCFQLSQYSLPFFRLFRGLAFYLMNRCETSNRRTNNPKKPSKYFYIKQKFQLKGKLYVYCNVNFHFAWWNIIEIIIKNKKS